MKTIFNTIRTMAKSLRRKTARAIYTAICSICSVCLLTAILPFKRSFGCVIAQNKGEGFVDTALKILMAVVIGALILAGLYALFGDTILPTLTRRIKEMFDYAG